MIRLSSIKERLEPIKNKTQKDALLVHEIYSSIQGESTYAGFPCVFIRTTGCHLRCNYCDTEHAFYHGKELSLTHILAEVKKAQIPLVELTGGEPLLQKSIFVLLDKLIEEGYTTLVETSGSVSIQRVNKKVKVILDIKCPDSGESQSIVYKNLDILWPGCEVKFVLSSKKDYEFAKNVCAQYGLYKKVPVLFSPVISKLSPQLLADYILKDKLPVKLQIQLHRVLWGEEKSR